MNQITIEYSQNVIATIINRAVVEGSLTMEAVACLNFLISEAKYKKIIEDELNKLKTNPL